MASVHKVPDTQSNTTTKRPLRRGRMVWMCVVAFAFSALLLFLGLGLSPVPGFAWIAPLPVLLLASYVSTRAALATTALSYVISTVPAWSFYAQSVDTPLWPIGVLIMAGFLVTLCLSVWIFRRLVLLGRVVLAAFVAPAVWTGVLFIISVSNPMGMMGTLATAQAGVPFVVKLAAVTGWPGIDYLVFFVPTAIAAALAPGIALAARVRTAVAAACVLVLGLGVASVLIGAKTDGRSRQIATIVHNSSPWGVEVATPRGRQLLDSYAGQIAQLPAGTDTAVLPEGAFEVDDRSVVALTERLGRTAADHHVTVVVGYNRKSGGHKFDTARILPADGGRPATYLKHHDRVTRTGKKLIYQPGLGKQVGVQICLDINLPHPSRDYAASGARMMLVPAADNGRNGWHHSRTAMLRGIENGFSVAWADMNGQAVIANSDGTVLADGQTHRADNQPNTYTTRVANVANGTGATPYTRYGDWFGWLIVATAIAGIVLSWYPRRPHRRPGYVAGRGPKGTPSP